MNYYLAIDIGASSGRHIVGWAEDGAIKTKEVYRFPNGVKSVDGHLVWDMEALLAEVKAGIAAAKAEFGTIASLSIDTWGVDFVLVDAEGKRVGDAVAYRDKRTEGMPEYVDSVIPFEELYAHTGIQKAIFNTIYQLAALKKESPEQLEKADRLLFIPDYLNFVLTGKQFFNFHQFQQGHKAGNYPAFFSFPDKNII